MALITTLRNKMGRVVVFFVGFSIITFVLTDFFNQNSSFFDSNDNVIGEIAGQEITREEYFNEVETLRQNYSRQLGGPVPPGQMDFVRDQAWELVFANTAFEREYNALGLVVTEEEVVDMVQGNNISPQIKQSFTNPETGIFDVNQVRSFLQTLQQQPAEQREAWYQFERSLGPSRKRLKYENMLLNTGYVTQDQAIQAYKKENSTAEINYAYVPFTSVPDSAVTVTDNELQSYMEKHAYQYEVDESRDLKYVLFPIIPSADDSAYFEQELIDLRRDFENTEDDSLFVRRNGDRSTGQGFVEYNPKNMPKGLQNEYAYLQPGNVYGPVKSLRRQFALYKVLEAVEDTTNFYCSTSHILVKWSDDSDAAKREARRKAQDIIGQLQGGANFTELAMQYSEDPSAKINKGVLGWISEDEGYVQEYKDAAFGAASEGLIARPVESQFGYHIIRIDHAKTNIAYKFALIEREVSALKDTHNSAYRKADNFRAKAKGSIEQFETTVESDSLTIYGGVNIGKNDKSFNTLNEARNVIVWLYRDASIGDVSKVFEVPGNYLVAVMAKETEEGLPNLEDVRAQITTEVKNEKKGELIKEKLGAIGGSTIQEIVNGYGAGALQYQETNLKLNSNRLTDIGNAPEAVGVAFAQPTGTPGVPVATESGVVRILTVRVTEAPEIADYNTYSEQLKQAERSRTAGGITEAIRKEANIVDERYKFN